MRYCTWLEICKCLDRVAVSVAYIPNVMRHRSSQEHAFEESQKYKEGKFIIEKAKVLKVRVVAWITSPE